MSHVGKSSTAEAAKENSSETEQGKCGGLRDGLQCKNVKLNVAPIPNRVVDCQVAQYSVEITE